MKGYPTIIKNLKFEYLKQQDNYLSIKVECYKNKRMG